MADTEDTPTQEPAETTPPQNLNDLVNLQSKVDQDQEARVTGFLDSLGAKLDSKAAGATPKPEEGDKAEGTAAEAVPAEKPKPEEVKPSETAAPPAATAPVAEPAATPAYTRKFKDEDLQPTNTDKNRTRERIQELWHLRKQAEEGWEGTKKEVAAREARIKELEEKVAQTASGNPEMVKKLEDEVLQYRRLYDLDNDPKVKADYDDKVTAAETRMAEVLKGYGIKEPTLDLITKSGGLASFSRSKAPINLGNGETVTGAELVKEWIGGMALADAESIRAQLQLQEQTRHAKSQFLESEKAKAKEHFSSQSKAAQEAQAQQEQAVTAMREKVTGWYKKNTAEVPWLKEPELKANATPEEKKSFEEEKAFRATLKTKLENSLKLTDVDAVLAEKLEAARVPFVERQLKSAESRIAALEAQLKTRDEELSKIRKAGRTTPTSGSVATPSAPAKEPVRTSPNNFSASGLDGLVDSLEKRMAEAVR